MSPRRVDGPAAFDVCGPLPVGTTVLEASAGTGKTFTIAALTTRYVADGVCDLDRIMLVTFGNAASRELRDRVRERMVSVERGLRDPSAARAQSTDPVLALLATGADGLVDARRQRLLGALAGFDAATIATTHSFCRQVLAGLGTAADADPDAVFTETIDDLRQDVVDDLYVRVFATTADEPFMAPKELADLGRAATGSDRQARLEPVGAEGTPGRRYRAAQAIRDGVARRKRLGGLVDHDDHLTQLRDALTDKVTGDVARERVRNRYSVVMVDEFQDTDPVQWDVLRLAFHGHSTLVLIGDPKQAIYGFRGGDVTTYLAATADATSHATLDRNWRSDADLVAALQHVVGGVALGNERIVVRPVGSAHPDARLTGAGPALRVRRLTRDGRRVQPSGLLSVGVARPLIAADVAADIVDLLSGPARLEGRTLGPADVAVLVRTNKQVELVREALMEVGVPAVAGGGGTVFDTPAARSWLVLLEAVEQPHRAGRVRAAALSVFVGHDEVTLDRDGDRLTDTLATRLRSWADLLARRGVAALLEVVSEQQRLPARVLARPDGERVLTDLRHTGQVLHTAALAETMGVTALVDWLRRRIARSAVERTDDRSRRLESDDDAVQVMTVHTSKGLEFPVVHVPYSWDRWNNDRPPTLRLHDEDGHRVLHVGGPASPSYNDARRSHAEEELGEDLRLLYVALTRASSHVVVHWAPTTNTTTSALHRVLFGTRTATQLVGTVVVPQEDDFVRQRLDAIATHAAVAIEDIPLHPPTRTWVPSSPPAPNLSVSHFTRRLDHRWSRTSYSALTRTAHEHAPTSEPEADTTTDERDTGLVPSTSGPTASIGELTSPFTDLPGGAAFGTLVHFVLEDLDPDTLADRCAEAVNRYRVPGATAAALIAALHPVLHTPLDAAGTTLAGIAAGDRLAELDFEMPLAGGDATTPTSAQLSDLATLLRHHDLGPVDGYADVLDTLEPSALRGYLTGSIDAVLRLSGPTYVVVDYKTNRLGPEPLTTEHYSEAAMAVEMQQAHYVLQALLYSVALHRFLRWRQPGYNPSVHLGGVRYLFLRGMAGPDTPYGAGVFTWTPPPALISDLSDLLDGRP